jgi:ABC-type nitrate/sulfonate/bicarbonate transport system permease component
MKRLGYGLWFPLTVLIAWQIASALGWLSPIFFPAPSVLAKSAAKMAVTGELARNAGATLGRTALGFLIGSSAGLTIGLLMGGMKSLGRSLEPVVSALNATPRLSLFPLLMLFFGVGETARLILIALSSAIIVAIAAFDAVGNIRPVWVDLAVNYGAGRSALFRTVYLHACLPQIFTGLRLALANALVIAISAELVSPSTGLGSMIWLAWETFSTDRLYVAIFVTAILGGLLHEALYVLERRVIPWKVSNGK